MHLPGLQSASPASLVARVLRSQLGSAILDYTFVDFCAGAGGPTPAIERALNQNSSSGSSSQENNSSGLGNKSIGKEEEDDDRQRVDFVLTDLHPHLPAWNAAALQSPNILFVPAPVDASRVAPDLLSHAVRRRGRSSSSDNKNNERPSSSGKKQFRLFSLAMHHFDDEDASRILRHALRTSSGFGVFELQARTFESLGNMLLVGLVLWIGSWWWFWQQWEFLFWVYLVPVVPFVVVYDGVISSLRTRSPTELMRLMKERGRGGGGGSGGEKEEKRGKVEEGGDDDDAIEWDKWHFHSGSEIHTWPLGELNWFVGVKEEEKKA